MTTLKTEGALLATLRCAAAVGPSAAEIREQRISFIMGSLKGDTVLREKVWQVLADHEGNKQDT